MTNFTLHLTFNSISCSGKEEIQIFIDIQCQEIKENCGVERKRSFSPSQVYKLLNLCSICFSVLCALLTDEIKIISLLVKNSVRERGDERRTDGDIMGTLFYVRRRQWHPTPVLLPGKSHGQKSLGGCSPWGC